MEGHLAGNVQIDLLNFVTYLKKKNSHNSARWQILNMCVKEEYHMGLFELSQMHGDILRDNLMKHFGPSFLEMS
jgi:hypothetical protein